MAMLPAFDNQVTDAKSAIDRLRDVSKTNVDAWYLAGSLAVSEERWDDAAAAFETLRSLPLTAGVRRKIDGHLVALLSSGLIEDLENKKFAKLAAVRLQHASLSHKELFKLIAIFELFDLEEEAKKLEKQIARAFNSKSGFVPTTPPASVDQVAKLKTAGKFDAAARLLSLEFRGFARQEWNINSTSFDSIGRNRALQAFKEKVKDYGLQDQLLKQLDPGENSNARRLGTWAIAQELFVGKDVAKSTYEKLLKAYPNQNAARLRYILLDPTDKLLVTRQIPKFTKRYRVQLLTKILGRMKQGSYTAVDLLSLAEATIDCKEGVAGDSIDDSLMGSLLEVLSSEISLDTSHEGRSLGSIYAKNSQQDSSSDSRTGQDEALERLANRRRILHDQVALRLTDSKVPGLARDAFTALLASTKAAGKPIDDQIVKLALKTVYSKRTPHRSGSQNQLSSIQPMGFNTGSSRAIQMAMANVTLAKTLPESGKDQVAKQTPVEFLARHYGLSKVDQNQQIELIAKKLESLGAKNEATDLRSHYALFNSNDNEFVGVASGLINSAKGTSRRANEEKWHEVLSEVEEIWTERKLQADISPFLIDYTARKSKDRRKWVSRNGIFHRDDGTLFIDYLGKFVEANDLPQAEALMTKLRLKMLGSEEEQRELAKLLVDQETVQKNMEKIVPIGTYIFISQSLLLKKTYWLGIKEMQRFSFPDQADYDFPTGITRSVVDFRVGQVDELLEWLGRSDVLAGLGDFDPYYPAHSEQGSVWGEVLKNLGYRTDFKLKAKLVERLSQQTDRTFGEKILLAVVKTEPINIYQILGTELDAFSALPVEQQSLLAKFARDVDEINLGRFGREKLNGLPTSKESETAKEKCSLLLEKSASLEVSRLMEARQLRDLGIPADEFEDWSYRLLASMEIAEADQLIAAILKISKLASTKSVAAEISQHNISLKTCLLTRTISKDVQLKTMKPVLTALESADFPEFILSGSIASELEKSLKSKFASNKTKLMEDDTNLLSPAATVSAMKQLIDQLGDDFGDRQLFAFLPELRNVCVQISETDAKAVDQWLHSEESGKHPEIKKTFQLAFDCSRDTLIQWSRAGESYPRRPEKTKAYLRELLNYIDDDSISLRARFGVAMHLVHYDALSCEGVAICTQVIAEAYDAGQLFSAASNEGVFASLNAAGDDPKIKAAKVAFAKSLARSLVNFERDAWRLLNIKNCLNTLAANGEDAAALELLSAGLSIVDEPLIAVTLIELGYFAEAKAQCESVWSHVGYFLKPNDQSVFTKGLESNLPELLTHFEDDETKYLAELYFSQLQNSDSGDVATTAESRLIALGNRFSSIKFEVELNRKLALILIAKSYPKSDDIAQALTEEVKSLPTKSLMEHSDLSLNAKLLGAYLAIQVQHKNFEPMKSRWFEINQIFETQYADGNVPWHRKAAVDDLATITFLSFCKLLRDRTPEQIGELLPVLRDLNQPSYQIPLSPNTVELAHLMAGRPDELATYLSNKNAYPKSNSVEPTKRTANVNELVAKLSASFAQIKPTVPATRARFATSVWRFGKSQGLGFGSQAFETGTLDPDKSKTKQGIEQFANLGMLTDEEILEVGPELAEINSVNGEIWLQLARRQAKAGQNSAAAESFQKSIEAATVDMAKAKNNRRVEYANVLVKSQLNEQAKKLIDEVRVDFLFDANKTILKQLEKTLKDEK